MDSAVFSVLTGSGVAGVVIILLITRVFVLGWTYRKLERENESLLVSSKNDQESARLAVAQLGMANQLIGELRMLARYRAGELPAQLAASPGPGELDGKPTEPARVVGEKG